MKIIRYFFEYILIVILFGLFKLLGYKISSEVGCLQLESCPSFAQEYRNQTRTTITRIRENGLLFKPVLGSEQIQLSRTVGNHSSGFPLL